MYHARRLVQARVKSPTAACRSDHSCDPDGMAKSATTDGREQGLLKRGPAGWSLIFTGVVNEARIRCMGGCWCEECYNSAASPAPGPSLIGNTGIQHQIP